MEYPYKHERQTRRWMLSIMAFQLLVNGFTAIVMPPWRWSMTSVFFLNLAILTTFWWWHRDMTRAEDREVSEQDEEKDEPWAQPADWWKDQHES